MTPNKQTRVGRLMMRPPLGGNSGIGLSMQRTTWLTLNESLQTEQIKGNNQA